MREAAARSGNSERKWIEFSKEALAKELPPRGQKTQGSVGTLMFLG